MHAACALALVLALAPRLLRQAWPVRLVLVLVLEQVPASVLEQVPASVLEQVPASAPAPVIAAPSSSLAPLLLPLRARPPWLSGVPCAISVSPAAAR